MAKDERHNQAWKAQVERTALGGREEREQRIHALPQQQRELAAESARLADLCQYFDQEKMDIPPEIVDRIVGLSRFEVAGRIRAVKEINMSLMEYLNRVGKGPQIRQ